MDADEKTLKKLLKEQKRESKKAIKALKDLDDDQRLHTLQRLMIADPETRDDLDKILQRFDQICGD